MSTTLPPLPDHPEPRTMTWSELERQAIKAYGEECARAALAEAAQSLPDGFGGGLVAIKTLLGRDPCTHAATAIAMIEEMLAASPAQPVQPTFCTYPRCQTTGGCNGICKAAEPIMHIPV